ncbi:MAG: hypothetical protein F4X64_09285 [Chloroflexi bacterium]|nr:hypothetical protein [Chloroflexota bacterium]
MAERKPISPDDFFSNAAAREAGFTDQFWFAAYNGWLDAINSSPSPFIALEEPHTVRLPYRHGNADVLVRTEPDGREYYSIRFTAFPAENAPTPRQISRWYFDDESRTALGEAALLDANFRW